MINKNELYKALNVTFHALLVIVVSCLLVIYCNGCASIKERIKNGMEFYDTPFYDGEDKITPKERAEFYYSNYPYCTDNEKIEMLTQDLIKDKANFSVITKEYRVNKTLVVWNTKEIFPRTPTFGVCVDESMKVYHAGLLKKSNMRGEK